MTRVCHIQRSRSYMERWAVHVPKVRNSRSGQAAGDGSRGISVLVSIAWPAHTGHIRQVSPIIVHSGVMGLIREALDPEFDGERQVDAPRRQPKQKSEVEDALGPALLYCADRFCGEPIRPRTPPLAIQELVTARPAQGLGASDFSRPSSRATAEARTLSPRTST